ncbi:hypothetical protein HZB74_01935 [Candidatus Saccharibacteria bacterium]|nr:hypothetical protein [Candidatus Saccharibacteria bacterium]
MNIEKRREVCPGFGDNAKGIAPYSGGKFDETIIVARISDPVYGEEPQPTEEEEPSEGTPAGVY